MILHLHRPAPPLDRFVELITYFEGFEPPHTKEKLLPDGAVEIIVDLTETPKRLYRRDDFSQAIHFRGAWMSGMRRDWIVIEAAPASSMAVIRFRPGGAYPFLGFAVEGITDTVDQLDVILGRATLELRERILEHQSLERRLAAIEAWLRERAGSRLEPHPVIEYLTGRLFAPAGLRIGDVVSEIGYSQRHVLGLFQRWVGLSPKQYARIRRFQQLLTHLTRGPRAAKGDFLAEPDLADLTFQRRALPEPDWADLAALHGYYDQSHLVRDFRELAGLTPSAYAAAYRGLENYLPLD